MLGERNNRDNPLETRIPVAQTIHRMKTQKLKSATAKIFLALALAFLAATVAQSAKFLSFEYCHGSSHNARGTYCETVYAKEPGYRALQ